MKSLFRRTSKAQRVCHVENLNGAVSYAKKDRNERKWAVCLCLSNGRNKEKSFVNTVYGMESKMNQYREQYGKRS